MPGGTALVATMGGGGSLSLSLLASAGLAQTCKACQIALAKLYREQDW